MHDVTPLMLDSTAPTLSAELIELPGGRVRLTRVDGGGYEFSDADPQLVTALRQLDGHATWIDIAATLPDLTHLAELRSWLTDNALLYQPNESSLSGWRVRLYGSGPLGTQLARSLIQSGVDRLTVVNSQTEPTMSGCGISRIAHDSTDLARIRFADHWMIGAESADIAIVAGSQVEHDRAVLADLHTHSVPTLVVSAHLDVARVGPLFVPQRTPCWRCRDLHITDRDPTWPSVLRELSVRPARAKKHLVGWAANLALLELSGYHDTGECDLLAHAVCWGGAAPGLSVLPTHPHEQCCCAR